jgi:4,5-dihydroxyphthalate decarboxylase
LYCIKAEHTVGTSAACRPKGANVTRPRVRLAARDWDHLTPLLTGAVRPRDFDLDLSPRDVTPNVLAEPDIDGGETSFSRYALARARGDDRLVGLPIFVMRGFRHRCILVRRDAELTDPAQLAGRRIGLTGWPDSGNTWTRAILREADVDLGSVEWFVGPLTAREPGRRPPASAPGNVHEVATGDSLVAALVESRLDAVLTPFMPPGFHEPGSPLRHLLTDYRDREIDYFARHGFVPGIHLLTLKRAVVSQHPWLPAALAELFDASKLRWHGRRRLLADTTPWLLAEFDLLATTLASDWMPYGVVENAAMAAAFCTELYAQGITPAPIDPEVLFADFTGTVDVAAAG